MKMNINEKKASVLNKATEAAKNLGTSAANTTSNVAHVTFTAAGSAGAAGLAMSGVATSTQVVEGIINTLKPITTISKARGFAGLTGKVVATTTQYGKVVSVATVSKAQGAAMVAANSPVQVPLAGVGVAALLAGASAAVTYARISTGYRNAKIIQKQAVQRLHELDISEEEVAEND